MPFHLEVHKAQLDLECAMMQLRKATDSRGLMVRLLSGSDSSVKSLGRQFFDFVGHHLTPGAVHLSIFDHPVPVQEDPDGEWQAALNAQLLLNAYVAALAYKRAQRVFNGD